MTILLVVWKGVKLLEEVMKVDVQCVFTPRNKEESSKTGEKQGGFTFLRLQSIQKSKRCRTGAILKLSAVADVRKGRCF